MGFFDWLRSIFDNRPRPASDDGLARGVGQVLNKPKLEDMAPPKPTPPASSTQPIAKASAPWYETAKKYVGKKEIPGSPSDPEIAEWLREAGEKGDESISWCAAFVGAMLMKAGYRSTGSAAARSYLKYGRRLDRFMEGCIVVLWRESKTSWKGHVGFGVNETAGGVVLLGGNQNDSVCYETYPKERVLGYYWPTEADKLHRDMPTVPPVSKVITTGRDPDEGTVPWYKRMFVACEIDKGYERAVADDVAIVERGEARYKAVEDRTGVPWWIIGAIHFKEASCRFDAILHNGQRGLIGPEAIAANRKSTIVPLGVGPFATWEDAAVDALKESGRWRKIAAGGRDIGEILYAAERYNGAAYLSKDPNYKPGDENSPYLWARSNINDDFGKFPRDHVFDPKAPTNTTTGLAVILKELHKAGKIEITGVA